MMATRQWKYPNPAKAAFEQMDRLRLWRGRLLDAAGFSPRETTSRTVHEEPGVILHAYAGEEAKGPALLIVPAPIKRAYIWDIAPEVSAVRRCLEAGYRVYLAEWTPPQEGQNFSLDDYADRLLRACADAVEADSGERRMVVAGHSLGGTLSAIFAALNPERVRALVLLEAPLHFGASAGKFAPLVAATPDARIIEETFGNVPGSFLNLVSVAAAPAEFHWQRVFDWSQSAADRQALAAHMRVERWMHDEFPLPGKLFTDVIERLYRNDEFMRGTLSINGRLAGPDKLTAPLLDVVDPRSTVIPASSIVPFHEAAASRVKRLLQYEGDAGVAIQHVGVLVGANAHARIWPAIFEWLRAQLPQMPRGGRRRRTTMQ